MENGKMNAQIPWEKNDIPEAAIKDISIMRNPFADGVVTYL